MQNPNSVLFMELLSHLVSMIITGAYKHGYLKHDILFVNLFAYNCYTPYHHSFMVMITNDMESCLAQIASQTHW